MARYRTLMRILLCVWMFFQTCDSDVKCKNDHGDEVDWYILYKMPNLKDGGLTYLYMDESTDGWTLSSERIDSTSGTLANTLKPLLDYYERKTEGFGYILYNDQPPNESNAGDSYGHSKGVLMLDRITGVWLSHSTPKFPVYQKRNFWPNNGNANAQTFMCVTYSYDQFKEIGLQLKYIHPYSYDYYIPKTFHEELRCVAQRTGCYPKSQPWFRETTLTSLNGHPFLSFAKYKRLGDDLYSGVVVKRLQQDLYVKSWGKMRTPLNSNCSILHRHVYNIQEINPPKMQPFSDTVDHSKWCVTSDKSWACVADMNREVKQMERGGGAICINDHTVSENFYNLITMYESCQSESALHREL